MDHANQRQQVESKYSLSTRVNMLCPRMVVGFHFYSFQVFLFSPPECVVALENKGDDWMM
jgi:hypothetical protein